MKPLPLPRGTYARLGVALVLALVLAAAGARAEQPVVYRWIDGSGIAHYTTQPSRIPREHRGGAEQVGRSPAQAPRAPGAAATPSAPAATLPPAVAAPAPSGPRVMPEGEFEEAPLGSAGRPPAQQSSPAPSTGPDVAAPPPGFIRGTAAPQAPAPRSAAPAPAPTFSAPPGNDAALDERIASLEEQVARDQSAIERVLAEPAAGRVGDRDDFRDVARRLPKLQADLKALREQRARQGL